MVECKALACANSLRGVVEYVHSGGNAFGVILASVIALFVWIGKSIIQHQVKASEKRRRQIELLMALRADVADTLVGKDYFDDALLKKWSSANQADAAYFPYDPTVDSDFVFDIIKKEMTAFEHELQALIAKYYYYDKFVKQIFDDLRKPEIRSLSSARKQETLDSLHWCANQYMTTGQELFDAIDRVAKPTNHLRHWGAVFTFAVTAFGMLCVAVSIR